MGLVVLNYTEKGVDRCFQTATAIPALIKHLYDPRLWMKVSLFTWFVFDVVKLPEKEKKSFVLNWLGHSCKKSDLLPKNYS